MYIDERDVNQMIERNRLELSRLIQHVKQLYVKNNFPGHGFDHVQRGIERSKDVCEGTGTSILVANIAYLCHDLHRVIRVDDEWVARFIHNEVSDIICTFDTKNEIIQAIKNHSTLDRPDETELEIIVKDIDRLDALGAIGMTRICQHRHTLPAYASKTPFEMGSTKEDDLYTLVDDLYRVLEWEHWLRMPGAKRIGKKLAAFTKNFLLQMESELIDVGVVQKRRVKEIFTVIKDLHVDHPGLPTEKSRNGDGLKDDLSDLSDKGVVHLLKRTAS